MRMTSLCVSMGNLLLRDAICRKDLLEGRKGVGFAVNKALSNVFMWLFNLLFLKSNLSHWSN